jgi:hypothetical protein
VKKLIGALQTQRSGRVGVTARNVTDDPRSSPSSYCA